MKIISPWIQLTNQCNLKCSYCFIKQSDEFMSRKTFKIINNKYSNMLNKNLVDKVQYRIAGGEPCLLFNNYMDLISQMIIKFKDRFNVELITNGTLLNDSIYNFLLKYKNNIGLCLSLDSIKESKCGTQNIVLSQIRKINKIYKKIGISISTVIQNNGIHLPDLTKFIIKNKFYWDINLDKCNLNNIDIDLLKINIDKMCKIIYRNKYPISNIQFNGIDFRFNNGCGAGERLVAIDTDGKEYKCQTIIGIDNPIEWDKKNCENCVIKNYCGYGCKYNNLENRNIFCNINKYYFLKGGTYAVSL